MAAQHYEHLRAFVQRHDGLRPEGRRTPQEVAAAMQSMAAGDYHLSPQGWFRPFDPLRMSDHLPATTAAQDAEAVRRNNARGDRKDPVYAAEMRRAPKSYAAVAEARPPRGRVNWSALYPPGSVLTPRMAYMLDSAACFDADSLEADSEYEVRLPKVCALCVRGTSPALPSTHPWSLGGEPFIVAAQPSKTSRPAQACRLLMKTQLAWKRNFIQCYWRLACRLRKGVAPKPNCT